MNEGNSPCLVKSSSHLIPLTDDRDDGLSRLRRRWEICYGRKPLLFLVEFRTFIIVHPELPVSQIQ